MPPGYINSGGGGGIQSSDKGGFRGGSIKAQKRREALELSKMRARVKNQANGKGKRKRLAPSVDKISNNSHRQTHGAVDRLSTSEVSRRKKQAVESIKQHAVDVAAQPAVKMSVEVQRRKHQAQLDRVLLELRKTLSPVRVSSVNKSSSKSSGKYRPTPAVEYGCFHAATNAASRSGSNGSNAWLPWETAIAAPSTQQQRQHNMNNANNKNRQYRRNDTPQVWGNNRHINPTKQLRQVQQQQPQQPSLPPWCKNRERPSSLHNEIEQVCEYVRPTEEEWELRRELQTSIQNVVSDVWKSNGNRLAKVETFGSVACDTSLFCSDVDMRVWVGVVKQDKRSSSNSVREDNDARTWAFSNDESSNSGNALFATTAQLEGTSGNPLSSSPFNRSQSGESASTSASPLLSGNESDDNLLQSILGTTAAQSSSVVGNGASSLHATPTPLQLNLIDLTSSNDDDDDGGDRINSLLNRNAREAENRNNAAAVEGEGEDNVMWAGAAGSRASLAKDLTPLFRILKSGKHSTWVEKVTFRPRAKVPIVCVQTRSGLECDIGIGGVGPDSRPLVTQLCDNTPGLRQLALVLKVILKQHDLDKPFSGGLGSFKLYMLLARHLKALQQRLAMQHKQRKEQRELMHKRRKIVESTTPSTSIVMRGMQLVQQQQQQQQQLQQQLQQGTQSVPTIEQGVAFQRGTAAMNVQVGSKLSRQANGDEKSEEKVVEVAQGVDFGGALVSFLGCYGKSRHLNQDTYLNVNGFDVSFAGSFNIHLVQQLFMRLHQALTNTDWDNANSNGGLPPALAALSTRMARVVSVRALEQERESSRRRACSGGLDVAMELLKGRGCPKARTAAEARLRAVQVQMREPTPLSLAEIVARQDPLAKQVMLRLLGASN